MNEKLIGAALAVLILLALFGLVAIGEAEFADIDKYVTFVLGGLLGGGAVAAVNAKRS